ncbi:hypothetical protein ACFL0W_04470 [Nanoarchaeota archaeon]
MLRKVRSKIVHSKLFIQRSMSYLAIINSGMILFLVLSQLERYGYDLDLRTWLIPIFLGTLAAMVLFGYLEDKLGFYKTEVEAAQKRNPQINKVLERLDDLESQIKNLNKKIK